MINTITMNNSPVRTIRGKVELYSGSTLAHTFTHDGDLVSIDVDRTGEESKFFGFGVSQIATIVINDKLKQYDINNNHSLKIFFNSDGGEFVSNCPTFFVREVTRDENTNQLTITAYDAIYLSSSHTFKELNLQTPYDIAYVAIECAEVLGLEFVPETFLVSDAFHAYVYENGANFGDADTVKETLDAITIREVLNAVAEATQTIYFANYNDELVFAALNVDTFNEVALSIEKSDYFTLESEKQRTITEVVHVTDLGDNVKGHVECVTSGDFLKLATSEETYNLKITVSGDTLEASTPVTITRCGKNLMPSFEGETTMPNGVTFSQAANGGVTVSGTVEEGDTARTTIASLKAPVKTGYLTVSMTGDFENIIYNFSILDSGAIELASFQQDTAAVINLNNYPTAEYWVMDIASKEAGAVSGTVFLQAEYGIGVTEYEPYSGYQEIVEVNTTTETVRSLPNTTILFTDTDGAVLNVVYCEREQAGETQYVKNNPFWELREDIADITNAAIKRVIGATLHPFVCSWRGNFLLEPCDTIKIAKKDSGYVYGLVLNDSFSYNGGFSQNTSWSFEEIENEEHINSSSLGDRLNQTFARVDKNTGDIKLHAERLVDNEKNITEIKVTADSASSYVEKIKDYEDEDGKVLGKLVTKSELEQTATNLSLTFSETINDININEVTTTTGFTFNKDGLTIQKQENDKLGDLSTTITEDGMIVNSQQKGEMLRADSTGVDAKNLHATTFLYIGANSRFEDYDNGTRTGCFWVGN